MGRTIMITSNADTRFNETIYRRLKYKIKGEKIAMRIILLWIYGCLLYTSHSSNGTIFKIVYCEVTIINILLQFQLRVPYYWKIDMVI